MEISKELFEEVMDIKVEKFTVNTKFIAFLDREKIVFRNQNSEEINLYEFIHKNCKEWALEKGYVLSSYKFMEFGYCRKWWNEDNPDDDDKLFREDNENEAVLKAIEYILEQTN